MKIRQAEEADYQKLMSLYNLFVGEDRYSKLDNDSFAKVLKSPNNFIYIAEENKQFVGFVSFSVRLAVRYPKPIAELDELYVLPEFRKKGVGKLLMNQIESKAKELNCYRIFIESHYSHKVAHQFYEKLEYKNYGFHFIKNLGSR